MIRIKQFANDIIWSLIGNVISKGSIFIISILTARAMSPEDFGRVSYLYQTIALIVIFSSMGLSVTAIRFTAKALSNGRDSVALIIKKLTFLVSIFSVLSIMIAVIYHQKILSILQLEQEQTFIIWLLVPIVIFTAVNQVQFGVLSGVKRFKSLAITNVLAGVTSVPIAYILVSQWLIKGYLISLFITALLTTIFNRVFIYKAINKIPKMDGAVSKSKSFKEIMGFAWPNLMASIAFTGSTWFCFSLLASHNLVEVAAFNVSNQWLGLLFLLPSICAQVLMSYTAGQASKSHELLKKSLLFNGLIALILSLIMMFFSHFLLGLYGDHYQEYTTVLNLCLMTLVVMALSSQVEHYMVGLGMAKTHLGYTISFSLIFIVLSYSLIDYGAAGIAAARLIAYIIKFIISFWFVNKVNHAASY
ncbi:oligosaccharide flippase family protein [Colwellia sp. Bg11-12]|uniref:oligosaccharide flippase family protein n=1 Tax=Colwellia sp. Bg11-12 TaxID=2759817 RepID=UPI0015F4D0F3|nr:oligosaccharide flippase family protein [Colwellia sp. Bg11-12]MBA6263217.1 oligosaccharide flippase family protein [Colwellia sp. Bg11-12]